MLLRPPRALEDHTVDTVKAKKPKKMKEKEFVQEEVRYDVIVIFFVVQILPCYFVANTSDISAIYMHMYMLLVDVYIFLVNCVFILLLHIGCKALDVPFWKIILSIP